MSCPSFWACPWLDVVELITFDATLHDVVPFGLYKTGSFMPSSLFFHSPSDYSCTNGFLHDPGSPILIALAPAHLDILESLRNRVTSLRPPSATGDQSWLWRPERRSTPVPRVQVAKQGCGEYFAPTSPQAATSSESEHIHNHVFHRMRGHSTCSVGLWDEAYPCQTRFAMYGVVDPC